MKLRPHQEDISTRAAAILREHHLVYLSMEVRCGKTLTALAAAEKYGAKKVLFVTKKKAIGSIESDDEQYDTDLDLTVTNYEQLHNIIDTFDLIIIDEAHSIGQFPKPAERTKLLKQICAGKPIIYLSGTPTPESYSQLYHQFWVSSYSPFNAYPNFYKWATDYVTVKKKYFFNREINDYSNADKDKIDLATSYLFLSFTQLEAGFEQVVKEEIINVQMSEGTYLLAEYLRKHRVYIGRGGEEVLADSEVKLMNKMHQVFSGTIIYEDKNSRVFDYTKARFIHQHFADQKIGVFYKFREERAMLLATFGADKITEDPMEFNSCTDKTFISQFQSGREGINLMTADCLVGLNIDFSAVTYWQFRARMQDQNRTKEAKLYWIFAAGGIESKIYERVLGKKDYTLSHFKKDYKIKATPMSNMVEQVGGFMKDYGIQEIQIGGRKIKRDRA
jgi:hypothetical protein